MLYLYTGTDREKSRAAMDAALKKISTKDIRIVRITDANAPADLRAALSGAGMFAEEQVVVCDGVFGNEEMRTEMLEGLKSMRDSKDTFFVLEEKPDAATRKQIEKYAEDSQRFDAPGKKKDGSIFGLSNALARRDKKALWVGYQRELAKGTAPEAIHGVLFWAVKNMFLSAKKDPERSRGAHLLAILAELPHESRRRGEEMEYALERFVLSAV